MNRQGKKLFSKQHQQQTGKEAENLAQRYLQAAGLKLVEQNYKCRVGEIDLIIKDKSTLVFVEVKTARSLNYGMPESWINDKKQKKITQTAAQYLYGHSIQNCDCRFDVVTIVNGHIHHFINAFLPNSDWMMFL